MGVAHILAVIGTGGPIKLRVAHILTTRTNQTQEAWVYSHDGPIRRGKRGFILTTDQSDTGSAGIFSQRPNQTQEDDYLASGLWLVILEVLIPMGLWGVVRTLAVTGTGGSVKTNRVIAFKASIY
eukprot:4110201-Pyramimonas_sp.AAC.1